MERSLLTADDSSLCLSARGLMSICTPYSGLSQTSFDWTAECVSSTATERDGGDSGSDEAERACTPDGVAFPPEDTPVVKSPREATE
jgi:hypothetical protein